MEEIWKDVVDYEGLYEVSSLVRARSLSRTRMHFRHKKILKVLYEKRILVGGIGIRGYKKVTLYKNGLHKIFVIHRLVAKAFLQNLENKPQVNHKNGIKTDNRVENLEWCSPGENIRHAWKNGLCEVGARSLGNNHYLSKLTEKQVLEIREKWKTGKYLQRELGDEYGVSRGSIEQIVNRKTWKHI